MKVFALGGYGKVGLAAVKLLAQSDLVTEIAIAGRNLERAEGVATEIGVKAIALRADGTDEEELTSLLAGYDILMNAAFNDTVLPAIGAAMRTGTHYCDANVVNEQTLQPASDAASAGITAIVATGVSPCISNLMAVHAARGLDEVEQLQLGRADVYNFRTGRELTPRQWLKAPEESLAALREFKWYFAWILKRTQESSARMMRVYHRGRWVNRDPIIAGLEVPLPQGGTITAYPYASADDQWGALPHDLAAAPPVEMVLSPFPSQLHNLLRDQALRNLGGEMDAEAATDAFYETVESDPHRWLTLADEVIPMPKMWARAVGHKEGRAARCDYWFIPAMWDVGGYFLTSVSLAVAVRKLLRGELRERGLLAAEKAFEPLPFLGEAASLIPDALPGGKMIGESFEWLE
jgi:hypothetical protein